MSLSLDQDAKLRLAAVHRQGELERAVVVGDVRTPPGGATDRGVALAHEEPTQQLLSFLLALVIQAQSAAKRAEALGAEGGERLGVGRVKLHGYPLQLMSHISLERQRGP